MSSISRLIATGAACPASLTVSPYAPESPAGFPDCPRFQMFAASAGGSGRFRFGAGPGDATVIEASLPHLVPTYHTGSATRSSICKPLDRRGPYDPLGRADDEYPCAPFVVPRADEGRALTGVHAATALCRSAIVTRPEATQSSVHNRHAEWNIVRHVAQQKRCGDPPVVRAWNRRSHQRQAVAQLFMTLRGSRTRRSGRARRRSATRLAWPDRRAFQAGGLRSCATPRPECRAATRC